MMPEGTRFCGPDELRHFVSALISSSPGLNWRHHQAAGIFQAYLTPDMSWRIHIHHPDLCMLGMVDSGAIHDHRFHFSSTVLAGRLHHDIYHLRPAEDGYYQIFDVGNASSGKRDAPIVASGGARFNVEIEHTTINNGMTYSFTRRQFHRSWCEELTVTLLNKFEQDSCFARLLAPVGTSPRHAFVDLPTPIDPAPYIEAAAALLMCGVNQ